MSTILLQRFANREYRLTHQDILVRKKSGGDKYAEKRAEKYAKAVSDTYVLQQELQQGVSASISDGRVSCREFGEVDARLGLRALDIINEFHLVQKVVQKGGWGHQSKPTKFTKNARHRLLEAGAVVDQVCGLNAYEVTCTLPGSTSDSLRLLAENTGWIMNEITRVIRKEKCKYWFYVWEFQKRGALHLHLLVASPEGSMESLAVKLQSRWWELLKSLSVRTGVDAFGRKTGGSWRKSPFRWQSHIAPIQKSVAAYFSKYAGKGSSDVCKGKSPSQVFYPSRWWGCSTEIKAQIKACRQKYVLNLSTSTSLKVHEYLHTMLEDRGRVRRYDYHFELGKTANGTELGWGDVCISYYDDESFARMQTWEKTIWDGALAIAHDAGEYDYPTQTWGDADMSCKTLYDADMERRHELYADMNKRIAAPALPPHSQPPSYASKLSKSRGTQAEPTLELRALALQFLAGGEEPKEFERVRCERATEYIQGELFDTNCYENLTETWMSYDA